MMTKPSQIINYTVLNDWYRQQIPSLLQSDVYMYETRSREFTYDLHLSEKSFKLLEVKRGSTIGGAATGSLPQPKHCVQHLTDAGTRFGLYL